jgi:hypothetical protein
LNQKHSNAEAIETIVKLYFKIEAERRIVKSSVNLALEVWAGFK